MSTRSITILCIVSFLVGLVGGFCISHFLLPSLWEIEETISQECVYEVEHNVCPVEEPPTECSIFVDVSGAVKSPGVYCFDPGSRVVDAIKKAGGFTALTSIEYVYRSLNLAKELANNQKIYVPSISELICELKEFTLKIEEIIPENNTIDTTGDNSDTGDSEEECVNINTASITELDSLDGVGPSTAQKIIDNRPYNSIQGILNVSGIGEAIYNKFKNNICI